MSTRPNNRRAYMREYMRTISVPAKHRTAIARNIFVSVGICAKNWTVSQSIGQKRDPTELTARRLVVGPRER